MRIKINEININPGRREASAESIEELARSISEIGLLNPITIDQEHTLIAGLHRLEAAKWLGWTEIECAVTGLEGLQAELAEIDENIVRSELSAVEYGAVLLRRKEIYEALHPETRATYDGGSFRGNQHCGEVTDKMSATSKSFAKDTADRLGVTTRTVERYVRMMKDLTLDTRLILAGSDVKLTQSAATKLSQLTPDQQKEAASMLVSHAIQSVDEYLAKLPKDAEVPAVPEDDASISEHSSCPPSQRFATIAESVTDLKNPDKDRNATPDSFLTQITYCIEKFEMWLKCYRDPRYEKAYSQLSDVQIGYLQDLADRINAATAELIGWIGEKRTDGE